MSDSIHERILWRSRLIRRRIHNLTIAASSKSQLCSRFDSHICSALNRTQRPQVPFVLADAAIGGEMVFEVECRSVNFTVDKFQVIDGRNYLMADWFVFPGRWAMVAVEENATYRCMRELAARGGNFSETSCYNAAVHRLGASGPYMFNGRHVRHGSDIVAYFENYSRLAASIRVHGFMTGGERPRNEDPYVGVAIGPSGEVHHFRKGHHRFAIARELGIAEIPVKVLAVHSDWLAKNLTSGLPPHRTLPDRLREQFKARNAG